MSIDKHDTPPPADPGVELARPETATPDTAAERPASRPDTSLPDDPSSPPETDLRAAAVQQRAQLRARIRVHRKVGRLIRPRLLRRRRLPSRAALDTLVAEGLHIGFDRDPERATHIETVVHAAGKAGAEHVLEKAQRQLDKEASAIDKLHARRAGLLAKAEHRTGDHVRHPDGGKRPVAVVQQDEAVQRSEIARDRARGSLKHQGMPGWIGHVPLVILVADFCLLLYFFSGITDVNWADPVSAALIFSVLLAAMVTLVFYGFLSFAGYRLRVFKDHSGAVSRTDLDGLTRAMCGIAIVGIVVVATLMFVRMRTEVLDALGSQAWATALVIALVLAVISAMANFLVVVIHALNGSDEVARLHALSCAANGPLTKAHRMREKAAGIPHLIAVRRRRSYRIAAQAVTRAGQQVSGADQVIGAARAVHQGAGPHSGPVTDPNQHDGVAGHLDYEFVPKADIRPIRTTLEHIDTDLPEGSSGNLGEGVPIPG